MHRSAWVIVIVSVLGLVIGQLLGRAVPGAEFLQTAADLGFKPITVDLNVVTFTLGFSVHLSVAGVIGMLVALYLILRGR